VSVITLISLVGVVIGVWVLIVVIAVMSGFDRELREKLMGINPHVTISGGVIENPDATIELVRQDPRVRSAAPFAMGLVLIEFNRQATTPYLKGVDLRNEMERTRLQQYITRGVLDLDGEKVVIGRELSVQQGIFVGDKITVYSPRNFEKRGEEVYVPLELTVTGIFESGMFEYDVGLMFTSLETAQELYGLGRAAQGIEVFTDDPIYAARLVADELNANLAGTLRAQTWADMNQRLLGAIQSEKVMMFFILIFIVLVAAFGITSTLITVTVQKTRDIGIVKALGASSGRILRIFLLQGFIVGVFGVTIGTSLGLLTIRYINPIKTVLSHIMGRDLFPREIYNFSSIPAYLTPRDLLIICVSALVICTLAGLIPALRAARLEPVEALRYE
jgi:lipoprotein-releasing system permease protein